MGCDCRSHPKSTQEIQEHKIIETPKLAIPYEYISVRRERTSYRVHLDIWIMTQRPYMDSKRSMESKASECLSFPKCSKDSILMLWEEKGLVRKLQVKLPDKWSKRCHIVDGPAHVPYPGRFIRCSTGIQWRDKGRGFPFSKWQSVFVCDMNLCNEASQVSSLGQMGPDLRIRVADTKDTILRMPGNGKLGTLSVC